MTSQEMENRSGVAKANIRYYEAEGLLTPAREKNGYRDYSENDLAVLEKIKLLRRLGVSIEELKELAAGTAELSAVLERRLGEVRQEQKTLERVSEVCGAVRASGETFATLNAEKYLRQLDEGGSAPSLPEKDALPVANCPWRRFFARTFDEFLLSMVMMAVIALMGINPARLTEAGALRTILLVVLAFALEPPCIAVTGTTPGKALLGLRLESAYGGKMPASEAYSRHFLMLWHGVGFYIPIWSWIQGYRSLRRGQNEEPQPWDAEVAYTAKELSWKNFAALAVAGLAVLAVTEAINSAAQLPPNRGDITVAEFAENYNRQTKFLGLDSKRYLDETGVWQEVPDLPGSVTIVIGDITDIEGWEKSRDLTYIVEDGIVTGITMQGELENCFDWVPLPVDLVAVLIPAYVWAQEDAPFWSFGRRPFLAELDRVDWLEDFELRSSGVSSLHLSPSHMSFLYLLKSN